MSKYMGIVHWQRKAMHFPAFSLNGQWFRKLEESKLDGIVLN